MTPELFSVCVLVFIFSWQATDLARAYWRYRRACKGERE
jgi:hypothetical protein